MDHHSLNNSLRGQTPQIEGIRTYHPNGGGAAAPGGQRINMVEMASSMDSDQWAKARGEEQNFLQ